MISEEGLASKREYMDDYEIIMDILPALTQEDETRVLLFMITLDSA